MAFMRGSPPEDYPVIRPPPMSPPPGHVPFDARPSYLESYLDSPPRGRGGVSPPSHPRFLGDTSPQRYLEAPPPGYQESPPRRFPGRISNPPPSQYLSPEDSPPYRYSEDPLLPPGIDGQGPRGFSRFGGNVAPGFLGHSRYHSESDSPSPPPGYFRPPPPPPGVFSDGAPRRFAREFRRHADDGSPPTRFTDEAPRRFGGSPEQFADGAPQGPPGPSRPPGYKENLPGRLRTEPGAVEAGYVEDIGSRHAPGGPPPEPPTPGFGPPGLGAQPVEFPGDPPSEPPTPGFGHPGHVAQPRGFPSGPTLGPPGPPDPSAELGVGTAPQQPLAGFPPSAQPPGPDPRRPQGTLPRYPPEALAGALGRSPGSEHSYPLQLRAPGSASPAYADLGGRFQRSPDLYGALPPHATPPREVYRPPPPGLGEGGNVPLLGVPPGGGGGMGGSPIPAFLFARPQRRHPDGYTAHTPPQEPPPRPPGLEHDAIFTAAVMPIELDEKLKEVPPHRGNPGSSTGGGWKDMWAASLFLVQIVGIASLSAIFGLQGLKHTVKRYSEPNTFHINDWFPQLSGAAVTGTVFAVAWLNFVRLAPVLMILTTVWTGAAFTILVGIVLIATGQTLGLIGIAFFFSGLSQVLYGFVVRDRIPFAGEMLKKVISVCNACPSTYGASYSVLLVSLVWIALWIFGLSGMGFRPWHTLIMVGFIASLLWTMQVLRNIVRVTVAGTVALFYFQEHNMPGATTSVALLRACTSSLGSICFGSLFVPLVEAPCHVLQRINSQAGASEFLFSCVLCFLACFEFLIQYFNRMGYIQVAVYGKPFLSASKDTWDMLRAQEVDVLVQDDLTSTIMLMACGVGGSLSALVGGIYTFVAHKSLTIIITIISYIIGALISYITMAVLESGVATYYVCFAEDPDSLQRHDGPFYERMWVRQMDLQQAPATALSD